MPVKRKKKATKKRRSSVSAFKAKVKRMGFTLPHGYELKRKKRK